MAKVFTTEDLIASVQRRASFSPDAQSEGKADQDIIDVLDEVVLDELVPSMLRFQEEFFTRTITVAVAASPNRYPVPTRAIGNSLRDIYWEDSAGKRQQLYPLARELLPYYSSDPGDPCYFYFEGDNLILVPPGSAGTLKVAFFFRPGQLVKAASYRKVTVVNSTTAVTLDSAAPSAWTTATLFDVHSKESGAEVRVWDFGASVVSGTGITFTQLINGSVDGTRPVAVGDYVVEAGHAAVPALPRDAHPVLAQAAACRLLESDGDSEMLKLGRETLGRMLENFGELFETRVDGKPQTFVNRKSLLFSQHRYWW